MDGHHRCMELGAASTDASCIVNEATTTWKNVALGGDHATGRKRLWFGDDLIT